MQDIDFSNSSQFYTILEIDYNIPNLVPVSKKIFFLLLMHSALIFLTGLNKK